MVPGFGHHVANARVGEGNLEGEVGLRYAHEGLVDRCCVDVILVEGRVDCGIEDDKMTLWSLVGAGPWLHGEHWYAQQVDYDPDLCRFPDGSLMWHRASSRKRFF